MGSCDYAVGVYLPAMGSSFPILYFVYIFCGAERGEYFETLGINVYDAWSFFKLLDADGGGCVEAEEFFEGCLRFRGQARAVEVGKVLQDQQWLIRSQSKFQSFVAEELNSLQLRFSGLVDLISATSPSMSRIHGNDDGTHARTREL